MIGRIQNDGDLHSDGEQAIISPVFFEIMYFSSTQCTLYTPIHGVQCNIDNENCNAPDPEDHWLSHNLHAYTISSPITLLILPKVS